MKLTNKLNLPAALVRAIQNDPYTKGESDYSATGLLKPARMTALEARHADELTEDVADRIWSLCGQIGHTILERCSDADLTEKRLFADIAYPPDQVRPVRRISGQLDLEHQSKIVDWKFTSSYSVKEGAKDEWEQQTNIGRWLCHKNGIEVEEIEIVAILRDWSKLEAKRDWRYPQFQVTVFKIPIWPHHHTEHFIYDRVHSHELAKYELPTCTPHERWSKPAKWAVMKKGRVRAVKLHDHEEKARLHAEQEKGYVQHRPGEDVRCQSYCRAAQFCEQYKQTQTAHEKNEEAGQGSLVEGLA